MEGNGTAGPQNGFPQAEEAAGGGGQLACAACRHQRRKCSDSCALRWYFPADKTEEFGWVQQVFGVKNLSKLISRSQNKQLAADTLIWEAKRRMEDPDEGCHSDVRCLERENHGLREMVHELLGESSTRCRTRFWPENSLPHLPLLPAVLPPISDDGDGGGMLVMGRQPWQLPNNDPLPPRPDAIIVPPWRQHNNGEGHVGHQPGLGRGSYHGSSSAYQ